MNIKNIVSVNLKKFRLKNNFSRYYLAKQLGKTPSCITNIEAGIRMPSLPLLFSLANFLQVDIRSFLNENEPADPIVIDWKKHWPFVGKNIVAQRKLQKISQQAFAKKLDITVAFLCNIEKGNCTCSLPMLNSIAEALHIDICDLFVLQ